MISLELNQAAFERSFSNLTYFDRYLECFDGFVLQNFTIFKILNFLKDKATRWIAQATHLTIDLGSIRAS
jgi:hypothetical protein